MEKQAENCGYILTDAERGARRFTKCVGIPLLLLFLLFLMNKTFKNWDNPVLWVFLFLWFVIVAFAIFDFLRCQVFDDMKFYVKDNKLANISKSKTENLIVVSNQFYITTLSVEFGYGKSTQTRVFYLFSYQSFTVNDIRGSGLHTLKYLTRKGIVIIPKSVETEEWLQKEFRAGSIPEFPASIVINLNGKS